MSVKFLIVLCATHFTPPGSCTECTTGRAPGFTAVSYFSGTSTVPGNTWTSSSGGQMQLGRTSLEQPTSTAFPDYSASQSSAFTHFHSPCSDCNSGGNSRRGRCRGKVCCRDSTCDMFQHYPYLPKNHGFYYQQPYNYSAVWKHQQWAAQIGGDPRNPYSTAMFLPIYDQFESSAYETEQPPRNQLKTLPGLSRVLPDLESLLPKREPTPDGENPNQAEPEGVEVPKPLPEAAPVQTENEVPSDSVEDLNSN